MHWPPVIPSGRVIGDACASMDLFPTLLRAAGGDPMGFDLDGADLRPVVSDGAALPQRDLFWEMNGQTAMRRGPWKLVLNGQAEEGAPPADAIHLSNLADDMSESRNLAGRRPGTGVRHAAKREAWRAGDRGAGGRRSFSLRAHATAAHSAPGDLGSLITVPWKAPVRAMDPPDTGPGRLVALAVAAHPDDIEFLLAGTLLQLRAAGAETHMWNLSRGACGTAELPHDEIIRMRGREAARSAEIAGARLHPPVADDLAIHYDASTLARVGSVIREVKPHIILTQPPRDYMEDHENTCRLRGDGGVRALHAELRCGPAAGGLGWGDSDLSFDATRPARRDARLRAAGHLCGLRAGDGGEAGDALAASVTEGVA